MKVIFVCTGNTCRSPLAEGLFKDKLQKLNIDGVEVTSAGLAAFAGDEVSANSVNAALNYGVDISAHRARPLSPYELEDSLIFCLGTSHYNALVPFVDEDRLFIMGEGISDPYGGTQEIYDRCAEEISQALDGVLKLVLQKGTVIEPMKEEHISEIAEIERLCFSLPWSENALKDELTNENAHFLTALTFSRVSGYIGIIEICGEADITNIAVHPDFRRFGIGKRLLDTAENEAVQRNCESITLEVRESNEAAISLYSGNGYYPIGIRKNFYEKPTENAVLMTKQLTEIKYEDTCN
ncbi:MAG: ribosomal protein S18-alanine N-acetyltransferase [Clostridia bacterium]|nr:ribosomal protein S18-alanine N-acetyltransferase [Clostridia bacterium]